MTVSKQLRRVVSGRPVVLEERRVSVLVYGGGGILELCATSTWTALAEREILQLARSEKQLESGGSGDGVRCSLNAPLPHADCVSLMSHNYQHV